MTGAKASAVLAASGGLVAAFALPAAAAPDTDKATTTALAPVTAPAAVSAAPAISAPTASAPAKVAVVGISGVTAVAKPKPKPVVAPVQTRENRIVEARERATSRDTSGTTRTARTATSDSNSSSTSRTSTKASRSTTRTPVNDNVSQSSSGVVNIARGLLGIAYVYGGSTPAGFDCSGFTQYVFGKAGISIPRTASAQQRAATKVSNPKPGDLVFWGYPAYHVGIYTGPDRMIDSPRTGKSTSERGIWGSPSGYGRF